MSYTGPERRKHPRVCGRFMVSYRIIEAKDNFETSQTKNISLGGMLLTTNCRFDPGMILAVEIRLPFEEDPIRLVAKVIESVEITRDLIYDTRLQFLDVDERHRNIINKTVNYYLNK